MQNTNIQVEKFLTPDEEEPGEKDREQTVERQERKEVMLKINTMKDFLDALYWSYDKAEETEKQNINMQILKIIPY